MTAAAYVQRVVIGHLVAINDGVVPFSVRYGLRDHVVGEFNTASRHGAGECNADQCAHGDRRCQCMSVATRERDSVMHGNPLRMPLDRQCCMEMTAEDLLCEPCREWCAPMAGFDRPEDLRNHFIQFEGGNR